jgi:hypothetical protein
MTNHKLASKAEGKPIIYQNGQSNSKALSKQEYP